MQIQTFNISMPQDLVSNLDQVAESEYMSRSELIKQAVKSFLERNARRTALYAAGRRAVNRLGIKSEEDVNKIVYEFRHGKKNS